MQDAPFRSLSDYRNVVNSLNDSTDVLEAQAEVIQRILNTTSNRHTKQKLTSATRVKLEQQQISELSEALLHDLCEEHKQSSEGLRKKLSSSLILIADTLRRDDHLLSQLESQLPHNADDPVLDDKRQDTLLNVLWHTLSEVIKTRLNRVYIETALTLDRNGSTKHHNNDTNRYDHSLTKEIDNINIDLRSLYAEIDDVAQMWVNHEHGDQIHPRMEHLRSSRSQLTKVRTGQTRQHLKAMTDRLELIAVHCEAVQSQRKAQKRLEDLFQMVTDTNNSKEQLSGTFLSACKNKEDGPAIAALRQYLGLGSATSMDLERVQQARQAFVEYIADMELALKLKSQQAGLLKNAPGVGSRFSDRTACESKLIDLDAHIAKIRDQMESTE